MAHRFAIEALSPRQRETAEYVVDGFATKEIAAAMKIPQRTVKRHLELMFARAGIVKGNKRIQLIRVLYPILRKEKVSAEALKFLSPKEAKIVALAANGLTSRSIASKLGVRYDTVRNYLVVIYDKLGVWTRAELALWYEARRK